MSRPPTGRCGAAVLAWLLWASVSTTQEVWVDTYPRPVGVAIYDLALGPSQAWITWDTIQEFCTPEYHVVMQGVDLLGGNATGHILAQVACGADGQPSAVGSSLASGHIVVAHHVTLSPQKVLAAVFDSQGGVLAGDTQINQSPGDSLNTPGVLAHPQGHFIVSWTNETDGTVLGRVMQPDGTLPSPEVLLPVGPPGTQYSGHLGVFSDGEVVGAWLDYRSPPFSSVRERRFDPFLNPLSGETDVHQVPIGPGPGSYPLSLSAAGTEYVVVWNTGGTMTEIKGRRLSQISGPITPELQVNTYTASVQRWPRCAIDATGRALVVWDSDGPDGSSWTAAGQWLDPSGAKLGPEIRLNMTTSGAQGEPRVAMTPSGDAMAVFYTTGGTTPSTMLKLRRFAFPSSLSVAPGPGAGNATRVEVRRPDGRPGTMAVTPYGTGGFGATVGAGEIDGDALSEVLTGPGPSPSFGPHVRAFQPDGTPIAKVGYYAYGTLKYGVKEGGANLDGDPFDELVTTPGPGVVFGPHVRGWGYDNLRVTAIPGVNFFAYGTLRYGANASRGQVDGDAYDEILTGPGPGPSFGAQVRGFDVDGGPARAIAGISLNAFTSFFGASVAAADVESDGIGGYGDGFQEILAGKGPDPGHQGDGALFDYDGTAIAPKRAFGAYATYGLNVAGGDMDAGDAEEVVTACGADPAAPSRVVAWEWNPAVGTNPDAFEAIPLDDFQAFSGTTHGCHAAIGTFQ